MQHNRVTIFRKPSESQLRKKLTSELGGKYGGVKASRKQLYGHMAGNIRVNDNEGTSGAQRDEDGRYTEDESSFDEEDEVFQNEDDENNDDHAMPRTSASESDTSYGEGTEPASTGKVAYRTMEDDSRAMIQELKVASSADVEKGQDVKKQLVRHHTDSLYVLLRWN